MIAKFTLRGIPKKPAGQVEVAVTFQIDENSILSISAKNTDTDVQENITIENSGKLTPEQMEKMKIAAVKAEIQDQQIALSANFKNDSDKAKLTGGTIPQSEIDAYTVALAEL
jgi:molecular chaperone DnaK